MTVLLVITNNVYSQSGSGASDVSADPSVPRGAEGVTASSETSGAVLAGEQAAETSPPSAESVGTTGAGDALPAEDTLVFGEGAADETTATGGGVDAFGVWDLLRMLLVLLMVIGAIYGVISLLRRRVNTEPEEEDSPIRVLASKRVGAGNEIHAVMIGRHVLVLGGGDGGLELITRVEDQETIDELVLAHSTGAASKARGATFGAVLGRWLGNLAVPGSNGSKVGTGRTGSDGTVGGVASGESGGTDRSGDAFSFFRTQNDRLRRLR